MKKQIKQVEEFQRVFGHPIGTEPKLIPIGRAKNRMEWLVEEVKEMADGFINNDLVEVADGGIDAIYIILGTLIECGLQDKITQLFDEVQRSNMSKLDEDGKPLYHPDGKVKKSALYSKPDLGSIINNKSN